MCRAVTCAVCEKTTWAGCGQHIDQVRKSVAADRWCPGHETTAAATAPRSGLLNRLFSR